MQSSANQWSPRACLCVGGITVRNFVARRNKVAMELRVFPHFLVTVLRRTLRCVGVF